MEKEKKDKAKNKVSKKADDVDVETQERGMTQDDGRASSTPPPPPADKGRSTPESFYFAHPRNIKKTTHFKDLHSRKLAELLEAFHMFDFDRDGVINQHDLRKTFASLCMAVDEEGIQQMLSEALNPLNFDAFVILLGYRTLELDPEEVLVDAFSNWDDQHYGLIPRDRLMHHIMAWGDRFTEEEAESALADAPMVFNKAKEKMIDYVQFSEDLCGLRKMMQRRANEEVTNSDGIESSRTCENKYFQ